MAGKTILVIDADVASRNFVVRTLQQQQHHVLQVGSGKEGLIAAWRDRPDLIIIEPNLPDLKGEDLATRLRQDPRTQQLPLVALSSDKTGASLRSCLDAGFNEFIVKSGEAVPVLVEAINRLLMGTTARIRHGGFLIAFLSAKGGVGTSSLCANLAMNISYNQPEVSVVVVDAVLPLGSIAPMVGYGGGQNLATAADLDSASCTPEYFRENLAKLTDWRFHLLAGASDPESANHLHVGRIREVVNVLKLTYDYVILDLGRSLSKSNLPIFQEADLVSLVMGTDASSVTLTKTVLDYLHSKGVMDASIFAIMNRASGLEGTSKPEAEKILGLDIKTSIPYLGNQLATASTQHQPYSLKFPKETATILLRDAAQRMTETVQRLRAG